MFGSGNKSRTAQGPAHTLISRQTEIIGDLRFSGELIIEGRIRGNIYAEDESNALVRVSENGVVEGEMWVPAAVINGLVKGDIHCSNHLELSAKAVVMGNVYYCLVEMVKGSEVNGSLMHIARAQQEAKRLGVGQSRVLPYNSESGEKNTRPSDSSTETIVD